MNLSHLFFCLNFASFSYAYYGSRGGLLSSYLGYQWTTFSIGRDIYSYGDCDQRETTNTYDLDLVKFGISENNTFYDETDSVDNLNFVCLFCFSFVMSNDSVLTLTGYYHPLVGNDSHADTMGVYYFNPVEMTVNNGSFNTMLPGSPTQKILHQAVMTPDKKSVYIFGGLSFDNLTRTNASIIEFDISSSTFISHGNFSYVGGTATMLPSGIVVLAFGAFEVNQINEKGLYNTSYVYLYDTNTNELYKQNISGTPPLPRVEASGTLGPDKECIYYFGGNNFDYNAQTISTPSMISKTDRYRLHIRSDIVILNTTSWTWLSPNISGPPANGRYGHFSLLYEDNTLIIGGGVAGFGDSNDISVLRNLPLGSESSNFDHLQWFTNSEMDNIYNDNDDTDKGIMSTGAIVGITFGIIIPAIVISYFIWKKIPSVKKIIWKRRLGEPAWTEILRTITRIILLGVLIAYIVFAVLRAIDSPSLNEERMVEAKKLPIPDIRICSTSSIPLADFGVSCSFYKSLPVESGFDSYDCSNYFYDITEESDIPSFDKFLNCKVFLPPLDIHFEETADIYATQKIDSINIYIFKENQAQYIEEFYVTYYTTENSQYRAIYDSDSSHSLKRRFPPAIYEESLEYMTNTVRINLLGIVWVDYLLTETRTLSNSNWNYIGFSNIYDTSLDITPKIAKTLRIQNDSSIYSPISGLVVQPSEFAIRKITEQKVSTILSGLASAGGVFSVIVAIQTLLFGFRPNSPWGIVQRWSFGNPRRSLRNQLRDRFSTDNAPVPMITRVRDEYHLLPTSSNSTALEMTPLNEGENDKSVELKFRKIEDRMQLMEDLFKTYYIDDEIFQKLNEARKSKTDNTDEKQEKSDDETSFTRLKQEDEEAPINQTEQYKDSRFLV